MNLSDKKKSSYAGIVFVVFLWGISPLIRIYLYNFYSPCVSQAVGGFFCVAALLFLCRKKLKLLNKTYFKVAVPTGVFYSAAEIMQKIGLQYTTPTVSAFLENLSCVVVPVLLFFFVGKKPTFLKIFASLICLASTFILNFSPSANRLSVGIGEILCATAGIFYGVNIAGTGAFAKKLDSALYILIQMSVLTVLSAIVCLALNFIKAPDGETAIEEIYFSFHPLHLLYLAATFIVITVLGWLIRTSALKYVDAAVVAIIMPFSAVVTSVASVMFRLDKLTVNLAAGAVLGLISILISAISDNTENKKTEQPGKQ